MLELPLPQLARLLHSGEVHPRDLVAEIDSALSGLTPAEHGFAHIDLDFALAQVEQLDTLLWACQSRMGRCPGARSRMRLTRFPRCC